VLLRFVPRAHVHCVHVPCALVLIYDMRDEMRREMSDECTWPDRFERNYESGPGWLVLTADTSYVRMYE